MTRIGRMLLTTVVASLGALVSGRPAEAAPTPPTPPTVEPRMVAPHEFTETERLFAGKAWRRAAKDVYLARWFVHQMKSKSRNDRMAIWYGAKSFPGNTGDGKPIVWFGSYSDSRFDNLRDVLDSVWEKFSNSSWKMKRVDCVVWAEAHVLVIPQVRLCNDFFSPMSNIGVLEGAETLVHEMSHHVWISAPLRQVVDNHVAPIPKYCNGACYGKGEARQLAQEHPQHAVANPDNISFFARSYAANLGI